MEDFLEFDSLGVAEEIIVDDTSSVVKEVNVDNTTKSVVHRPKQKLRKSRKNILNESLFGFNEIFGVIPIYEDEVAKVTTDHPTKDEPSYKYDPVINSINDVLKSIDIGFSNLDDLFFHSKATKDCVEKSFKRMTVNCFCRTLELGKSIRTTQKLLFDHAKCYGTTLEKLRTVRNLLLQLEISDREHKHEHYKLSAREKEENFSKLLKGSKEAIQEEAITHTKFVIQCLEVLKNQFNFILNDLLLDAVEEKSYHIEKALKFVESILIDTQLTMINITYIETEVENQELKAQLYRFCEEYLWLRNELLNTQLALQDSVQPKCLEMVITKDNSDLLGAVYNNFGVTFARKGDYQQAMYLCDTAFVWNTDCHPNLHHMLNNLALLYQYRKRYRQAEEYYGEALRICEKMLGQDDPNFAEIKNNLASMYLKQRNFRRAETLYKEILTSAHVREFGVINDENKPIWKIAEIIEEDYDKCDGDYKVAKFDSRAIVATLENLAALYRRHTKDMAAVTLEDCAEKAKKEIAEKVLNAVTKEIKCSSDDVQSARD